MNGHTHVDIGKVEPKTHFRRRAAAGFAVLVGLVDLRILEAAQSEREGSADVGKDVDRHAGIERNVHLERLAVGRN